MKAKFASQKFTQTLEMFLLGTLLMALRGRRTRTVRIAERLMFCRSREYSTILHKQTEREAEVGEHH